MEKVRNAPPIELLVYIYEEYLIPALIEQDMLEDHLVDNLYEQRQVPETRVARAPRERKRKVTEDAL